MNAGVAAAFDRYYQGEESKQIDEVVKELLSETSSMNYVDGVVHVNPIINNSPNTESIKERIFRRYCQAKIQTNKTR
jgi:hypothetical protein